MLELELTDDNEKKSRKVVIFFFLSFFLIFILLSYFRDARLDENIYIGDSAVIAELLKDGKWIGNYGIGLHGFLTKLIVGVIFVITGPSVFIATLINVLLGIFSGVIFFNILKTHFKLNLLYSLVSTALLFCSYQFITYIPTFYRDIGALFSVLLLLDSILLKRSKWIIGLILVLILDSKEHVFYTFVPALIIWIGIESFHKNIENQIPIFSKIKIFLLSCVQTFLPVSIFLVLMFTTSIIPLNIYNAKILGLTEAGINGLTENFEIEAATINRDYVSNPEHARVIPMVEYSNGGSDLVRGVIDFGNSILSYIGKVLYPRTFSFLSVPFVILVPSLVICFDFFKKWIKTREYEKIFIIISIFTYLFIYIFHASISRYILPISPFIFLFFIIFLKNLKCSSRNFVRIIVLTIVFTVLGLSFEYSYVLVKIIFSLLLIILFFMVYRSKEQSGSGIKVLIILLVSGFMLGTSILSSYKYGQIGTYLSLGYDRDCEKIMKLTDNEKVWINDIGWDRLPNVLRSENVQTSEWKWNLQSWLPKNDLLEDRVDTSIYYFNWKSELGLQIQIDKNNIEKIVYVDLDENLKSKTLIMQDRADQLLSFPWLELTDTVELENKTVYVFDVVESELE